MRELVRRREDGEGSGSSRRWARLTRQRGGGHALLDRVLRLGQHPHAITGPDTWLSHQEGTHSTVSTRAYSAPLTVEKGRDEAVAGGLVPPCLSDVAVVLERGLEVG